MKITNITQNYLTCSDDQVRTEIYQTKIKIQTFYIPEFSSPLSIMPNKDLGIYSIASTKQYIHHLKKITSKTNYSIELSFSISRSSTVPEKSTMATSASAGTSTFSLATYGSATIKASG